MPKDTSMVKVNYEGKTIDGKVFDSSFKRGQAVDLRANQVIKGWTEALVHMPAGSVWEIYIPQQLAYGEREQGQIKPFSVLIFKIELISVVARIFVGTHFYRGLINEENINDSTRPRGGCFFVYS